MLESVPQFCCTVTSCCQIVNYFCSKTKYIHTCISCWLSSVQSEAESLAVSWLFSSLVFFEIFVRGCNSECNARTKFICKETNSVHKNPFVRTFALPLHSCLYLVCHEIFCPTGQILAKLFYPGTKICCRNLS